MKIENLDYALVLRERILTLEGFKKWLKERSELQIGVIVNHGYVEALKDYYELSKLTYCFPISDIKKLVLAEEKRVREEIENLK